MVDGGNVVFAKRLNAFVRVRLNRSAKLQKTQRLLLPSSIAEIKVPFCRRAYALLINYLPSCIAQSSANNRF